MKHLYLRKLALAACLLAAFALFTALVSCIDVQPVGPNGSSVGFASLNQFVHQRIGVHLPVYVLTDWLSLIPLGLAARFAFLGLAQWVRRKSLLLVDRSILILGGFYLAVIAVYLLFEAFPVNYRPVLIDGQLEASYPSSTTVLVLCVMVTAAMQLRARIRDAALRIPVVSAIAVFTAFMVLARLLSGVHWLTDILGGTLVSSGLVMLYHAALSISQP